MWPLPRMSSAKMTSPGRQMKRRPSLDSSSRIPEARNTSCRRGALCRSSTWPSGVSRKNIELHLKVSDMGRSARLNGTSRTSIADSPESLVNILTMRMRKPRSPGGAMLPQTSQAARADAETQIDAVSHRDDAAQDRVGRNAEIGLIEGEPPGHVDQLGVGVDSRRRLQHARDAVQRDRDAHCGFPPARVHAAHPDERERKLVRLQHSYQHVGARSLDVGLGGLCVDAGLGAQRRLVHLEALELDIEIGAAFVRRDVAADLMAGDDMVVPQARKRPSAAHLVRDERLAGIDAKHGPPLR